MSLATASKVTAKAAVATALRRHTFGWLDVALVIGAVLVYVLAPGYLALATTAIIAMIFALSLDLVVGYAGIETLGHAAFFGVGAYVGALFAKYAWADPVAGLLAASLSCALLGVASGVLLLRTRGLTLVMLTLAVTSLLYELANTMSGITGGADGLGGYQAGAVLGIFDFDLTGHVAFWYAVAALGVCYALAHVLVNSPLGLVTRGIRDNPVRIRLLGISVLRRLLTVYAISGGMAGVAGAISAQVTGLVGLDNLTFLVSGNALIMLALGGSGRLQGALVGAAVLVVFSDRAASIDPYNWLFALGILLILVVRFAPRGLVGLLDSAKTR